jgi:hypothetical protein
MIEKSSWFTRQIRGIESMRLDTEEKYNGFGNVWLSFFAGRARWQVDATTKEWYF